MSISSIDYKERIAAAKQDIERLKSSIENRKITLANGSLSTILTESRPLGPTPRRRKVLQGHFNKVYALDWAGDSERLVSASQDGKLMLWNGRTRHKLQVISLKSNWVMTCAIERSNNQLIASGGLDNICSIHEIGTDRAVVELQGHDGYLSSCAFVEKSTILTASGDSTCIVWDINKGQDIHRFTDHGGDIMTLSVHPTNRNIFVSGSCDTTAKVWDLRVGKCIQTFIGHEGDINAIKFMNNGLSFGTGSDDSSIKIFDLRSYARINEMGNEAVVCGVTGIDFSLSGRIIFAGYDDSNCLGWDTLLENSPDPVYGLVGHTNRVSCVGVNPSGQAICTGSWDSELAIWA